MDISSREGLDMQEQIQRLAAKFVEHCGVWIVVVSVPEEIL